MSRASLSLTLLTLAACTSATTPAAPPVELSAPALGVDEDIVTLLHATWTDEGSSDAWIEYRFEGDDWAVAPELELEEAVILGVPAETEVEARVVQVVDGEEVRSPSASTTTGTLPERLPLPTTDVWDPALASSARYALVTVDAGAHLVVPPFWLEIFDRQGRIVWYMEIPDAMGSLNGTVALDGTHLWFEQQETWMNSRRGDPAITRRTLDGRWSEALDVPDLGQAVNEGPDGSFFYEDRTSGSRLNRVDADGTISTVWDASAWMTEHDLPVSDGWMNTVTWSDRHDSVIASMFESDTAFEIDLATGTPIRQFGQISAGDPYAFNPAEAMFDYQHNPHWTDDDTLLVSTHVTGETGLQVAAEYAVDDATGTLTRVWTYESTDIWATQAGEANRLANGNTLQGYGQDGAAREVTPDGETAWQVRWEDRDAEGDRLIGHMQLIDDLYAINAGPVE